MESVPKLMEKSLCLGVAEQLELRVTPREVRHYGDDRRLIGQDPVS